MLPDMRQKLPAFLKLGCLFLQLPSSNSSRPFFLAAGTLAQQRAELAAWLCILVLTCLLPPILIPLPGTVQSCLRCHQSELVPRCRFEGLADRVICDQPAEPTHHAAIRDLLEWETSSQAGMEPGTSIGGAVKDANLLSPRQSRAPRRDISARAAHRDDGCIHRHGFCVMEWMERQAR